MRWLTVVLVMTGCGAAQLEHAASFDFGDVALGQARTATLQVRNSGARAASLTWSSSDEFSVEGSSTTLGAGDALTLRLHFTPADLGPRTGTLIIRHDAEESTVSLSGRGTGPRLSVAHEVTLGEIAIISGQPLPIVAVPLVVTNAGTAGSALHLEAPSPSGDEVCVGTFDGLGVCTPWTPPATLAAGEVVTLPVHVRPTTVGARTWSVTLASDDPLTRAQVVTLRAVVAQYEPCLLSGPQQVLISDAPVPVVITHRGAGTCLVRSGELASSPASAFLLTSPGFPARLEAGGSLTLSVSADASAPRTATGVLRVTPAAGAPHEVAVGFKPPEEACLTLAPATLDFGTVMTGCGGLVRHVQLYNTCATPITLESISVTAAAGLGPGTAGCPGTTPCPEFSLSSTPGLITLDPAPQSALVSVRYSPLDLGVDQGAVSVVVRDGGEFVLSLQGRGDLTVPQTDSFRDEPLPVADVLVMVDTSPSFAPQRPAVRANLASWLSQGAFRCLDLRWAFAPADGAPDAGVAFARNDAGNAWTSTLEPDFVARALSAFDALPGGSETEACIGPAAALMQTVAPRDAGTFGGLCITDALEQSPAPMGALAQLQARLPTSWTTWSVVAGFSPGCTVEAQDDGVHSALVQASNGARESICAPDWWIAFLPLGGFPTCGARSEYFLNSRPAPGTLEVRVDGVLVPASDWSYDAANNSVTFASGHAPRLGATITAHYVPSCTP